MSRQTPSSSAIRSRRPTTRNPARSWSAMLAAFSGNTLVWIVQIPAAAAAAGERLHQRGADTLAPGGRGDVDAVLGHAGVARPARDGRERRPADDRARRARRRSRPSCRRVASKAAHDGGSVSNVALPVAIPSAQIAATSGQSASVISRSRRRQSSLRTRIDLLHCAAVEIRRPDPMTDFDEVLALVQACDRAVYGDSDWTAAELREEWDDLDLETRRLGRRRRRPDRGRRSRPRAPRHPGADGRLRPPRAHRPRRRVAAARRRGGPRAGARRATRPRARRSGPRRPTSSATRGRLSSSRAAATRCSAPTTA